MALSYAARSWLRVLWWAFASVGGVGLWYHEDYAWLLAFYLIQTGLVAVFDQAVNWYRRAWIEDRPVPYGSELEALREMEALREAEGRREAGLR